MSKLKFTKKLPLTLISIIVLMMAGLVGYEWYLAHQYSKQYDSYLKSPEYAGYAASMRAFLNADNGIMAKMYDCSASAQAIWNHAQNKSVNGQLAVGSPAFQYQALQATISSSLKSAQNSQPVYPHDLLVNLLPSAKHSHQLQQSLNDLFVATQSMQGQPDYCPDNLYDAITALQFLQRDSNANAVSGDATGWNSYLDLVQRVQKPNFGLHGSVPVGATAADVAFRNTFLPRVINDLQYAEAHPRPYTVIANKFSADATDLDISVLPQAALYGKTLSPSVAKLTALSAAVDD